MKRKTVQHKPVPCTLTEFGFAWGSLEVTRLFCDDPPGWVAFGIQTPKHQRSAGTGIQVYVTRSGTVRVHDNRGEWTPPKRKNP